MQMKRRHSCVLFFLAMMGLVLVASAAPEDTFTGVRRIVAVGDVHGDFDRFVEILHVAAVIDGSGNWTGGKTHLVQTGDILDRSPDSRKVMDLLMGLEPQALSAGGRVHALTGNHEAMNVYGDLRYVIAGEFASFKDDDTAEARRFYEKNRADLEKFTPKGGRPPDNPPGFFGHRFAFASKKGKYGAWIRRNNSIIRIDDTLFMHGGLNPRYGGMSIRQINDRVRAELDDFPNRLEGGLVLDFDSPLWYRGLVQGEEAPMEDGLKKTLAKQKAVRMVVGHTVAEGAITPRFDGRVLMIDIGLSRPYGGPLACLVIEDGKPYALYRAGKIEIPSAAKDLVRYLKRAAQLESTPALLKRLAQVAE